MDVLVALETEDPVLQFHLLAARVSQIVPHRSLRNILDLAAGAWGSACQTSCRDKSLKVRYILRVSSIELIHFTGLSVYQLNS